MYQRIDLPQPCGIPGYFQIAPYDNPDFFLFPTSELPFMYYSASIIPNKKKLAGGCADCPDQARQELEDAPHTVKSPIQGVWSIFYTPYNTLVSNTSV